MGSVTGPRCPAPGQVLQPLVQVALLASAAQSPLTDPAVGLPTAGHSLCLPSQCYSAVAGDQRVRPLRGLALKGRGHAPVKPLGLGDCPLALSPPGPGEPVLPRPLPRFPPCVPYVLCDLF